MEGSRIDSKANYSLFAHNCKAWYVNHGKDYLTTVLDAYDDNNSLPKDIIMPMNITDKHWLHMTVEMTDGNRSVTSVDYMKSSKLDAIYADQVHDLRMYLAKFCGMYLSEKDGDEQIYCGSTDMFRNDAPETLLEKNIQYSSLYHKTYHGNKAQQQDGVNCGMFVAQSIVHCLFGRTALPLGDKMISVHLLKLFRLHWTMIIYCFHQQFDVDGSSKFTPTSTSSLLLTKTSHHTSDTSTQ